MRSRVDESIITQGFSQMSIKQSCLELHEQFPLQKEYDSLVSWSPLDGERPLEVVAQQALPSENLLFKTRGLSQLALDIDIAFQTFCKNCRVAIIVLRLIYRQGDKVDLYIY